MIVLQVVNNLLEDVRETASPPTEPSPSPPLLADSIHTDAIHSSAEAQKPFPASLSLMQIKIIILSLDCCIYHCYFVLEWEGGGVICDVYGCGVSNVLDLALHEWDRTMALM